MTENALRKIAIISGVCVENDAISASARDDALSFSEHFGFQTRVFTYENSFTDIDVQQVHDSSDILFDPFFCSCDLIIYHFGIFYELFNVIFLGNGRAPQAVRYHNLTPRELLPQSEWVLFDRSLMQLNNLNAANAIWPVSDINRRDLLDAAIVPEERVEVIPLSVGDGRRRASLRNKPPGIVRLLFVGRFVRSKGLVDLLQAAHKLKESGIRFSLRLVGETRFSHPHFIQTLQRLVFELGLENCVKFVGGVSDDDLQREFADAHIVVIPSYHEGFCKPVVEGMYYGCIPVTYDSTNLKFIARGLSQTVATGNWEALAQGIAEVAESVASVLQQSGNASIAVDCGRLSLHEYESGVDEVLAGYGFPAVSVHLRDATEKLIAASNPRNLRVSGLLEIR